MTKRTFVSGDWEYQGDLECYETAYEAVSISGHYSYGVAPVFTRQIVDAFMARQSMLIASGEPMDRWEWEGDLLKITTHDEQVHGFIHPNEAGDYDLASAGYCFNVVDDEDNVIRRIEDRTRPEPRSYVVGLPVVVTVHPDGTVEYEIDTAEAGSGVRENYDGAVAENDATIIDADHARGRA